MKNKMEDLRNHLFATLEALQDTENPMELDRARTIADVAGKVVDTAKVEVEFLKTTGAIRGSDFFPEEPKPQMPTPEMRRQLRAS
jgi:hypothetical protein